MSDLDKIYIRSQINGNWDSYSLQELLDQKHGGNIAHWFLEKIGLVEGAPVTKENVEEMVRILEASGYTIVKFVDQSEEKI